MPDQEAALAAHVGANSDMTLAAMQSWLEVEHGVRLSNGAVWTVIDRLGLTLKKRRSGRASRTGRTWQPSGGSGAWRSASSMAPAMGPKAVCTPDRKKLTQPKASRRCCDGAVGSATD
jgi:hypothetical protein